MKTTTLQVGATVAIVAALSLIVVAVVRELNHSVPRKAARIDLGDGRTLDCQYELTLDGLPGTDESPPPGLAKLYVEWLGRAQAARNFDEYVATFTKASAEKLSAPTTRETIEQMMKDGPKKLGTTFFLSVYFEDAAGEHIVYCSIPGEGKKFADGAFADALTKEAGVWKRDLQFSSPLLIKLASRDLSDFGGPDLPKERADKLKQGLPIH